MPTCCPHRLNERNREHEDHQTLCHLRGSLQDGKACQAATTIANSVSLRVLCGELWPKENASRTIAIESLNERCRFAALQLAQQPCNACKPCNAAMLEPIRELTGLGSIALRSSRMPRRAASEEFPLAASMSLLLRGSSRVSACVPAVSSCGTPLAA
jgi:hypothetical protein